MATPNAPNTSSLYAAVHHNRKMQHEEGYFVVAGVQGSRGRIQLTWTRACRVMARSTISSGFCAMSFSEFKA